LGFITDNHFNPTVMTQALYRSYRYGQSKPVFAYRFMTEGSMEEKIYSRSVNKTGVALRVIDGKSIGRHFTERELRDLQATDTWVQCDR
jgi:transcriptional regulator ATRX